MNSAGATGSGLLISIFSLVAGSCPPPVVAARPGSIVSVVAALATAIFALNSDPFVLASALAFDSASAKAFLMSSLLRSGATLTGFWPVSLALTDVSERPACPAPGFGRAGRFRSATAPGSPGRDWSLIVLLLSLAAGVAVTVFLFPGGTQRGDGSPGVCTTSSLFAV